jgi:CheY-like chemotaxis protein
MPAAQAWLHSGPSEVTVSRSVLIVDDNEDSTAFMEIILTRKGHVVRVAHDPNEALRLFAELRPDVALLDIGLPIMDGYELARRIRAVEGGASTKLIAITGFGGPAERDKATQAGFDAHMVKPASVEELAELIERT